MIALLLASTLFIGNTSPKVDVTFEVKGHAVVSSDGTKLAKITEHNGTEWEGQPKWVYEFKDAKEAFKVLWEEGYQKRCACPAPVNGWYGGAQTLGR